MSYIYSHDPNYHVTTPLNSSFPQFNWPGQQTFHKASHAVHNFVHPHDTPDLRTPNADVRETVKKYYIDIELPGVSSKDELSLTWTSTRTLLVEATIKRPEVPEEQSQDAASLEAGAEAGKACEHKFVHFLARERKFGLYGRAFHLPFDIDHDKVETTMKSGLLRVVIPKPEIAHHEPKKVEVKHEDD